ncbi:hypothetical protein [Thalassotalea litorea]|uniref:hypothetical protein n=1 Tax=Thalassotalea litorea TaxID=2020715 RepID=UPI003735F4F7
MRIFYTVIFIATVTILITINLNEQEKVDLRQSGVPLCDFQIEPCRYSDDWGVAVLTSSLKTITSEEIFDFYLDFNDEHSVEIKSAFLQGRDMYMGKIPLFFNYHQSRFTSQALLGACTEPTMVWRMTINAEINHKPRTLHFDFASYQ